MNMGEENEDIIFDNRPARSLDDLDSRRDRSDRGNGRGRRDGKAETGEAAAAPEKIRMTQIWHACSSTSEKTRR